MDRTGLTGSCSSGHGWDGNGENMGGGSSWMNEGWTPPPSVPNVEALTPACSLHPPSPFHRRFQPPLRGQEQSRGVLRSGSGAKTHTELLQRSRCGRKVEGADGWQVEWNPPLPPADSLRPRVWDPMEDFPARGAAAHVGSCVGVWGPCGVCISASLLSCFFQPEQQIWK